MANVRQTYEALIHKTKDAGPNTSRLVCQKKRCYGKVTWCKWCVFFAFKFLCREGLNFDAYVLIG